MNKLQKTLPSSPTPRGSPTKGVLISSTTTNQHAVKSTASAPPDKLNYSIEPLTANEQYWATRALKAEALLSAKELHHRELKTMNYSQDLKRAREISQLLKQHEAKHASLEKLVLALVGTIILLILIIIYLSIHHARHASKAQKSQWLAGLPSHFTIPILSPFTSVVEQETSVFGTKTIAIIVMVSGTVAYFAFRYWISLPPTQPSRPPKG